MNEARRRMISTRCNSHRIKILQYSITTLNTITYLEMLAYKEAMREKFFLVLIAQLVEHRAKKEVLKVPHERKT